MSAPACPKCGEILENHSGRGGKYFHLVAFGPYNGVGYGTCELDAMAFEVDGTPIAGSDAARRELTWCLHGHKPGYDGPVPDENDEF